jgi:hypothetical protein
VLPYGLTEGMEEWLIKSAVYKLNLIPTRNSVLYESPRERLMGKKISVKNDLKHGFGDYVHVHNAVFNNSMQARTAAGVALMPAGSTDGSWYYWLLKTNKVVRRRRATALPMPDEIIKLLENRAAKRRGIKHKALEVKIESTGEYIYDKYDDEYDEENEEGDDDLPDGAEFIDPNGEHYDDIEGYNSDIDEGGDDNVEQLAEEQQQQPVDNNQLLADIFGPDSDEDEQQENIHNHQPIEEEQQPLEPPVVADAAPAPDNPWAGRLRERKGKYHRLASAKLVDRAQQVENDRIYGLKLTIAAGLEELGDEAMTSIISEMK